MRVLEINFYKLIFLVMILCFQGKSLMATDLCTENGVYNGTFNPTVTIGTNQSSITYASSLGVPTIYSFWNIDMVIHGTLIVDQDLAFWYADVKMEPGAEIVIEANKQVSFVYSDVFACLQLWKGIYVEEDGWINIQSSRIGDAQYLISSEEDGRITVANSELINNDVSFKNINPGPGQTVFDLDDLTNISIEVGSIRSAFPGMTATTHPKTGFLMTNCVSTIGRINTNSSIEGAKNGVYMEDSNVIIYGYTFERCDFGIKAVGGSLTSKPVYVSVLSTYLGKSTYQNPITSAGNGYGIHAVGTNLDIERCTFKYLYQGVRSTGNVSSESINIAHNEIDIRDGASIRAGIYLERSVASGTGNKNNIENNTIVVENGINEIYGIFINSPLPASDEMIIKENVIEIQSAVTNSQVYPIQIWMEQSDKFLVLNNEIYFNNSNYASSRWGISMINGSGQGSIVGGNTVVGASSSHYAGQCAIHLDASKNIRLCDNNVDKTLRGFHFAGNNDNSEFISNSIGSHDQGIYLATPVVTASSSPIMGDQIRRLNQWNGTYPTGTLKGGAVRVSTADPLLSEFKIQTGGSPYFPPSIYNNAGWFSVQSGLTEDCNLALKESSTQNKFSRIRKLVATENLGLSLTDEEENELKRDALLQFLLEPVLIEKIPNSTRFLKNNLNTPGAKMVEIDVELKKALVMSNGLSKKLIELLNEKQVIIDQLGAIGIQYYINEELDSVTYQRLKNNLLSELAKKEELHTNLENTIVTSRESKLKQVSVLNNQLGNGQRNLQNQKDLNDFIILKALKKRYNEQLNTILNIARMDKKDGGRAVISARAMLPLPEIGSYIKEEDHLNEQKTGNLKTESFEDKYQNFDLINIYPNPAGNLLTLTLSEKIEGELIITDLLGKIVLKQVVNFENTTLDVSNLNKGVYIISVVQEDGISASKKFVIK